MCGNFEFWGISLSFWKFRCISIILDVFNGCFGNFKGLKVFWGLFWSIRMSTRLSHLTQPPENRAEHPESTPVEVGSGWPPLKPGNSGLSGKSSNLNSHRHPRFHLDLVKIQRYLLDIAEISLEIWRKTKVFNKILLALPSSWFQPKPTRPMPSSTWIDPIIVLIDGRSSDLSPNWVRSVLGWTQT